MTCGELLSMPAGVLSSPVTGFGSGNVGTPWARMQRDTARSLRISAELTCGDVVGVGRNSVQARCAAWNVGEEASLLEIWAIRPLAALMPADDPKEPGPGKFETPLERMHAAYCPSSPPDDDPPVPRAAAGEAVVVVRCWRRPPSGSLHMRPWLGRGPLEPRQRAKSAAATV